MNTHVRDNLNELRTGGIAIASQAANQIIFASSASQLSRSASLTYDGTTFLVASFSASHAFGAGGTGEQRLTIRNSTAGTGNAGVVAVGNDGSAGAAEIYATSTTFTPTSELLADCVSLRSNRVGGLSLAAGHASGVVRVYANGFTQRMQVAAGVTVGDTTDPGATNFRVAGTSALVGNATFSAVALLANGTVGAPSLAFTSETDTGIYLNASDTLGLVTRGVCAVTITGGITGGGAGNAVDVPAGAWGTGGVLGSRFTVGRNSSGNGAAGLIGYQTKSGTGYVTWVDATGDLRIGLTSTEAPEEDGTPSDTGATAVGDQSSWYTAKRIIRKRTDSDAALRAILDTPVYDFQYKASGYLDAQGRPAVFTGVVGRKRSAWFLKNVGPQQHPCLNEINVAGYTVLAIQALTRQLAETRAELRRLQRQSRTV